LGKQNRMPDAKAVVGTKTSAQKDFRGGGRTRIEEPAGRRGKLGITRTGPQKGNIDTLLKKPRRERENGWNLMLGKKEGLRGERNGDSRDINLWNLWEELYGKRREAQDGGGGHEKEPNERITVQNLRPTGEDKKKKT